MPYIANITSRMGKLGHVNNKNAPYFYVSTFYLQIK